MEGKKLLFALLALFALSNLVSAAPLEPGAEWYTTAGIAVLASAMILIAIYMAGFAIQSNEMKFLATEEFYQLVVTIVMMAVIAGAIVSFDGFSAGIAEDMGYTGKTMQAVAKETVSLHRQLLDKIHMNMVIFGNSISDESSKSAFCMLQGVGFGLAGCGGYRMLSPPVSLGESVAAVGFAELEALKLLLDAGTVAASTILLPAGIFLRVFKFTRPAGGLLIALAIALYLALPLAIVSMNTINAKFFSTSPGSAYSCAGGSWVDFNKCITLPDLEQADLTCNPWNVKKKTFEIDIGGWKGELNNIEKAFTVLDRLRSGFLEKYVSYMLVMITLMAIVSIMVMAVSVKYLAGIAGADVDITALARIA